MPTTASALFGYRRELVHEGLDESSAASDSGSTCVDGNKLSSISENHAGVVDTAARS